MSDQGNQSKIYTAKIYELTNFIGKSPTEQVKEAVSDAASTATKAAESATATGGLRFDYQPWEYFLAPKDQAELTHKYSVLRRSVTQEDVQKSEEGSTSLRESINCVRDTIRSTRTNIQSGTSLQVRYYGAIPLILSPLLLFRSKRPRRILSMYGLTSYFVLPEPIRAILDAK